MDFIRSAYSVDFKFGPGADTASRVRWWFPPPGTPFFPGDSCMRSLNWWDKEGEPARVGEVWPGNRKYSKGQLVPGYNFGPPCGSAEAFRDGVPSPPPPTPHRDAHGVPDCCAAPCQPWWILTAPTAEGGDWVGFVDPFPPDVGAGNYFFYTADFTAYFLLPRTEPSCGASPYRVTVIFQDFTTDPVYAGDCTLEGYSDSTQIGIWRVPADSPRFAGSLLSVRWAHP